MAALSKCQTILNKVHQLRQSRLRSASAETRLMDPVYAKWGAISSGTPRGTSGLTSLSRVHLVSLTSHRILVLLGQKIKAIPP